MALRHGKDTVVTVATFDLSVYTKTSTLEQAANVHNITGYTPTGDAETNQGGTKKATFSMGGVYDDGTSGPRAKLQPLLGTTVSIVRKPAGTGTGKAQDVFSAVLEKYVETNPFDDMISWTAEFTVSGVVNATPQP